MKVEVTGAPALEIKASVLAVPVFEEEISDAGKGLVGEIDRKLGGHLTAAAGEEDFAGKPDQVLTLRSLDRLPAERVTLHGIGTRERAAESLSRTGFEALRMAAGAAARAAQKAGASRLAVVAPRLAGQAAAAARAIVEGALLGAYRFDRYKTEKKRPALQSLTVALPQGLERSREVKDSVALGRALAEATAWARDLVNEPPLACTPSRLAQAARELARQAGLTCEVHGPREIAALRMGMFLGVARGSAEEPRLVKVSYVPKGAAARRPPLVLVGKAITFDSGGLSLKPTEGMVDMKTDMAGSAAVFAALKVIAGLEPSFPVHALVGSCENMPGGRAYKPSDILTARNGKTVEVTNTDAEGRLVLGDILAWGVETLEPAAIVDVATLTGACVVALGSTTIGAFGPDGPVIERVVEAARASGEDLWRLPLTDSVKETLKSEVADMKNTGERWGGAISAAHFLREFVGETPWAHLDIAGPSSSSKERGYVGKGGTGCAVRTLVELVRAWEREPPKDRARGRAAGVRRR
jgi:leucyl aminopeptidase